MGQFSYARCVINTNKTVLCWIPMGVAWRLKPQCQ